MRQGHRRKKQGQKHPLWETGGKTLSVEISGLLPSTGTLLILKGWGRRRFPLEPVPEVAPHTLIHRAKAGEQNGNREIRFQAGQGPPQTLLRLGKVKGWVAPGAEDKGLRSP